MDQDRQRDARVVDAGAGRAVGLLGAGAALDDRVDGLEVARVRAEGDGDLAGRGLADALGAEVVLDVAGAAFGSRHDGLDRPLALELTQDRLVRLAERVREDGEPAAVGHADHDLVCAGLGGERDRLVEHRHHRVEALDRERLLAEEHAAQVALHPLHLAEPLEQALLLIWRQRLAVLPRLDRLAQPDAELVLGDVLDLVGDRPAVGLAQARERVGERLGRDIEAEQVRRDLGLELGRQLGDQALGIERGVADGLGAERVEMRGEVAVHAVRLDERHCGGDAAQEQLVRGRGRLRRAPVRARAFARAVRDGSASVPAVRAQPFEQPREARQLAEQLGLAALEERTPLRGDRLGILEVLLEDRGRVARVQAIDFRHRYLFCSREPIPAGASARTADAA